MFRAANGTTWSEAWLTSTGYGNCNVSFATNPSAGYWCSADSQEGGGAGGTLYMGSGWSVTLPEAALFMAALPAQRAAVVLGATKVMVVDLDLLSVSVAPLVLPGVVKGFSKEWDRDELVIRTDSPTQTLIRLTIDP